jgi:hypothetical protein
MNRFVLALGFVVGLATSASAGEGDKGWVTAYDLDGTTVITSRSCISSGRYSYDYTGCGRRVRDSVKIKLCARLGKGTHYYLYQIGDARPTRSSVWCKY